MNRVFDSEDEIGDQIKFHDETFWTQTCGRKFFRKKNLLGNRPITRFIFKRLLNNLLQDIYGADSPLRGFQGLSDMG